ALEWAGKRLRWLTPATEYTYYAKAVAGGLNSATVQVGAYATNADCDVNDTGGLRPVRGSDFALLRHALETGATLGVDQPWSCDVNDDGVVDLDDMTLLMHRLRHPE
ncbi:hypothetical protein HQ560_15410, partial [bacterium]|nr:hypothetical protein [bacterium]